MESFKITQEEVEAEILNEAKFLGGAIYSDNDFYIAKEQILRRLRSRFDMFLCQVEDSITTNRILL